MKMVGAGDGEGEMMREVVMMMMMGGVLLFLVIVWSLCARCVHGPRS